MITAHSRVPDICPPKGHFRGDLGLNYRGVGQTRTMEIAKKPSGLPRLVRITPTVRITRIAQKTDFFDRNCNLFFYKKLSTDSAPSIILIRFGKLDFGGLELKKVQKYSKN